MPYCPFLRRKVTYLDCQECDEKICKTTEKVIGLQKEDKTSSIPEDGDSPSDSGL